MKVVITGATGFLGRPICKMFLQAGHAVTALTRNPERAHTTLGTQVECLAWGENAVPGWKQAVAEADAVVHLAGEPIGAQKWTPAFKQKILASRVKTTRMLVAAICEGQSKPGALISASGINYYGDRKNETVTEETKPGDDFLAQICRQWEAEAEKAAACGVRVARLRTAVVLGHGGALERMLYPLPLPISPWKLGLAGKIGSGRQWFPWVHIEDAAGLYVWAATHAEVSGPVNVTAPNPVTNAQFTAALARALHRPAFLPLPAFALRAIAGEFAETLLIGQKALPTVALKLGYQFRYPDLDAALHSLLPK